MGVVYDETSGVDYATLSADQRPLGRRDAAAEPNAGSER